MLIGARYGAAMTKIEAEAVVTKYRWLLKAWTLDH